MLSRATVKSCAGRAAGMTGEEDLVAGDRAEHFDVDEVDREALPGEFDDAVTAAEGRVRLEVAVVAMEETVARDQQLPDAGGLDYRVLLCGADFGPFDVIPRRDGQEPPTFEPLDFRRRCPCRCF